MLIRNITGEQLIQLVTEAVKKALAGQERRVPVGISMRHVHLNARDLARLFGPTYVLTPYKSLSQPGQFAAEESVDVIGPKGMLRRVRILGPLRKETQIELAQTDCRSIGVKAPVRASGHLEGTPGITLRGPCGEIAVDRARHLVTVQNAAVSLTLKEFELLCLFMENPGLVFTRDQLLRSVWGAEFVGESRTVDVHIGTLRTKLGQAGKCIGTVRGVGYKMEQEL